MRKMRTLRSGTVMLAALLIVMGVAGTGHVATTAKPLRRQWGWDDHG